MPGPRLRVAIAGLGAIGSDLGGHTVGDRASRHEVEPISMLHFDRRPGDFFLTFVRVVRDSPVGRNEKGPIAEGIRLACARDLTARGDDPAAEIRELDVEVFGAAIGAAAAI